MVSEHVILVDQNDQMVGTMEKMRAHQEGLLHRAFSIFVFNSQGELLIQKRAPIKYHTGSLWSNTCCSHPKPNESVEETLQYKLHQEMGFQCELERAFSITYRAELGNGLVENELDHVYIGSFNGDPQPNHEEVCDWKYIALQDLKKEMEQHPNAFTPWFKLLLQPISRYYSDYIRV